jgi:hypothetical protein
MNIKSSKKAAPPMRFLIVLAGLFFSITALGQTVVYTADFESGKPAEFSAGGTSNAQIGAEAISQGMSTYLGKFTTNGSTTLTVTGLPAHSYVRLDVDVYFFQSWDGSNGSFGPDYFSLAGDLTFAETFTNHHGTAGSPQQSYPTLADVYLNSSGTALASFGSSGNTFAYFSLGPASSGTGFVELHSSDDFTVTFGGPTTQTDEQWGIDNVIVTVCDTREGCEPVAGPAPEAEPSVPVPVMGGPLAVILLVMLLGLTGTVILRR